MKISKIIKSRNDWKTKAKYRGIKLRNQKKIDQAREKRTIQNIKYEEEIRCLKDEIQQLKASDNSRLQALEPKIQQKTLCVFIVIFCVVSFRSVPRILQAVCPLLLTKIKIPHFTSVINWTLRTGIATFNQVTLLAKPWIAIIDCSIDVGIRKALVVLRVPIDALQNSQKAIRLKDCECIGLEVPTKWNGQLVLESLIKIFDKAGFPSAIIKDGGTDLNKGVELFCAINPENKIFVIPLFRQDDMT
jgi:hypothetical protein